MKKTAKGRTLDMAELRAKHELMRAVGNTRMNARGDQLDAEGNIVTPATHRANEKYTNTVRKNQ